jgi:S1-C subfamily serine protease
VDDGLGGISDDFSICLTEDPALPPRCHYTASVISRDAEKDIALLQIDPQDIFGRPVNFKSFNYLPIDYDYVPKSGDTVLARGYPWVGANTITETQGIVSGTYAYNNNTYIKTDTLIAGGNSGGPLLRDGKMIGVNTFLIGGFFDPALGYSLSIPEAKNFIQTSLTKITTLQTNNPQFAPFLQTVSES